MRIYNSADELLLEVAVDDSSCRNRQIMGDHNLTLHYSLAEHVELPVGSHVEYQGIRYTLDRPEAFKMKHRRLFEYTVVFEAHQSCAKRWKFRNTVDGRLKFPLTAKPVEHLQMFVDNMNRRDGGWTVGECIDAPEHLVSYDHDYCLEALRRMADEFNTEFEIVGKAVSLRKVEYNKSNPLPLAYGRGRGFKPNVGRSNSGDSMPVEILFAQGGSSNIDPSKYGARELHLPAGATIGFDGEHFSGEAGFNEDSARWYVCSEDGLSVQRGDKPLSSQAEDSLDCTDIFPRRVGVVGQVLAVDADKHFYDFTDKNDPDDPCPDYGDCLIAGETMSVIFQSGMLAGRELEVKYIHEPRTEKGIAKPGRRFEIVPQEIDGITMPDESFKPAVGDKFVVYHCNLPQEYITAAEMEMFKTAVRYFFDHEEQQFSFTGELDGIWAKRDWENIGGRIVLGGYVSFTDESFQAEPVLVRITGIKDYINNPHSPEITLSNETVTSGFGCEFKKVQADELLVEEAYNKGQQFTRRRFRDAAETMQMLEKSLVEGFTGSISPVAAQMLQLLVGDESLQFRFVTDRTAEQPNIVSPTFSYDAETRVFSITGGYFLQHLTLGINSMQPSHSPGEYKWWSVQPYTSAVLDDSDKKYYLYLKCPEEGGVDCGYVLSEGAVSMTGVEGFYHFLVGVLNTEYEGERSFTTLYGFTEIAGGRISTDRIVGSGGQSYFDLVSNSFSLGDKLMYNVGGDGKLRLKGSFVQSGSGALAPVTSYRGNYSSTTMYYEGDTVSWTDASGNISTYLYRYSTPAKGKTPSNTTYWSVYAKGSKGQDGTNGQDGQNGRDGQDGTNGQDGLSVVWKGDLSSPPSDPQKNWVYRDTDNGYVYIYDGSSWVLMVRDGDDGEDGANGTPGLSIFITYHDNDHDNPPARPTGSGTGDGWHTNSTAASKWLSQKTGLYANVGPWGDPIPFVGRDGQDGQDGQDGADGEDGSGVEWMFIASSEMPPTPVGDTPEGWSQEIPNTSNIMVTRSGDFTLNSEGYYDSGTTANSASKKDILLIRGQAVGDRLTIRAFVDSEQGYDWMAVGELDSIAPLGNANTVIRISGLSQSAQHTFVFTDDSPTIVTVQYTKDASRTAGSDKGWYDFRILGGSTVWVSMRRVAGDEKGPWSQPAPFTPQGSLKSIVFLRQDNEPQAPQGGSYAAPVPDGWSDGIPDGVARLWSSTRLFTSNGRSPQQPSWTTPRAIADSADFDVEFSSEPTPSAPAGHPNTNAQWSNEGTPDTIWMATSVRRNGVWSDWSISKIKGEKGEKGDDGNDGADSPILVPRGEYRGNAIYYGNAKRIDAVRYDGVWYKARINAPGGSAGFAGKTPSGSSSYWEDFGASFSSVATELVLANEAYLAGFRFKDGVLQSQYGYDENNAPAVYGEAGFMPNLTLDGVNGIIRANKGYFAGGIRMPFKEYSSDITLTANVDSTSFYLAGNPDPAYLNLPNSTEFSGWMINVYVAPRISYMDGGGGVRGRIYCPLKNTLSQSSIVFINEYIASSIYFEKGAFLQLVCIACDGWSQPKWTLINMIALDPTYVEYH